MISKWILVEAPCEKDPKRYKLKLMAAESDVTGIIKKLGSICGRPFPPLSRDYNWAFYLYNVNETDKEFIEKVLKENENKEIIEVESLEEKNPVEFKLKREQTDSLYAQERVKEVEADKEILLSENIKLPSQKDFWGLSLNSKYTFENFVVGQNSRFAQAAAVACSKSPGQVYNPFFIYGSVGLGKSHLMHAIAHEITKNNPAIKLLLTSSEKFISEVIESVSKGILQEFRDKYRSMDVLMVDDIQFLSESESTQEEFFHIFNILYDEHKQIVLTSDRPPKQLVTLEDRLRSRFEWGLIADIKFPNLETRIAILKKKGEIDKLNLDDNILSYIASRLKSNIRELEGFLKRIKAYSALTGVPIDLDMVRNLLNDLLPEKEQDKVPTLPHVTEEIVNESNVLSDEIVKKEPEKQQEKQLEKEPEPLIVRPFRIGDFGARKSNTSKDNEEIIKKTGLPQHFEPFKLNSEEQTSPPPPPPLQQENSTISKPVVQTVYKIPAQNSFQVNKEDKQLKKKEDIDIRLKPIEIACFYPEGKEKDMEIVKDNFREVIKKHKLKFRLEYVFDKDYSFQRKINYGFFAELCKTNKVTIAVILGPPADAAFTCGEFEMMLSAIFEDERISFQMINYTDITKQYKFLNIALDITLLKNKEMYG